MERSSSTRRCRYGYRSDKETPYISDEEHDEDDDEEEKKLMEPTKEEDKLLQESGRY